MSIIEHRPASYPRERCKELRARCLHQARKHKDNGNKTNAVEWLGYALYWHTRVCNPAFSVDQAQDHAHKRGTRWNVRSAAVQAATVKAVTMGAPMVSESRAAFASAMAGAV